MKTAALIIAVAAALALGGCGSSSKPLSETTAGHGPPSQEPPHAGTVTFTAPTTTTIAKPQTGTTVRCTSHGLTTGAIVPAPGHGVTGSADGTSSSAIIELSRRSDGSLVVSCTR
jgi:hypothetical protein